ADEEPGAPLALLAAERVDGVVVLGGRERVGAAALVDGDAAGEEWLGARAQGADVEADADVLRLRAAHDARPPPTVAEGDGDAPGGLTGEHDDRQIDRGLAHLDLDQIFVADAERLGRGGRDVEGVVPGELAARLG